MNNNDDKNEAPVVSEESIAEAPKAEPAKEATEVLKEATEETKEPEETKVEEKKESASDSGASVKNQKAVSKDLQGLIEKIEKLSVLELADLVHALEDRFGVTAAAPMAMTGPAAASIAEPAEEKTSFNVILTSSGANKIGAIKAVRELVPTLGLKEAKDLVEAAPKPVMEGVNKATADEAKTKLTAAGATVELQ